MASNELEAMEEKILDLRRMRQLLREALGELLDPPQGTSINDRITKGRFALEATKETP